MENYSFYSTTNNIPLKISYIEINIETMYHKQYLYFIQELIYWIGKISSFPLSVTAKRQFIDLRYDKLKTFALSLLGDESNIANGLFGCVLIPQNASKIKTFPLSQPIATKSKPSSSVHVATHVTSDLISLPEHISLPFIVNTL